MITSIVHESLIWFFSPIIFQGAGPYTKPIKQVEDDIQAIVKRVNELTGE